MEVDSPRFAVWSCMTTISMCRIALHADDPDEEMKEYFDAVPSDDEDYLKFALGMWKHIRTLNATDLETVMQRARRSLVRLSGYAPNGPEIGKLRELD